MFQILEASAFNFAHDCDVPHNESPGMVFSVSEQHQLSTIFL